MSGYEIRPTLILPSDLGEDVTLRYAPESDTDEVPWEMEVDFKKHYFSRNDLINLRDGLTELLND